MADMYPNLANLTLDELAKIQDDDTHPLHAEAIAWGKEVAAPFIKGIKFPKVPKSPVPESLLATFEAVGKNFAKLDARTPIVTSSFTPALTGAGDDERPPVLIPHNPTWDLLDEQRALNETMREMVVELSTMGATAAQQAKDQKRSTKIALIATWVAVGVTVVVGIAQIIVALVTAPK